MLFRSAANAGLFAVQMLSTMDAALAKRLADYKQRLRDDVARKELPCNKK